MSSVADSYSILQKLGCVKLNLLLLFSYQLLYYGYIHVGFWIPKFLFVLTLLSEKQY
jgi:hypothetical protein